MDHDTAFFCRGEYSKMVADPGHPALSNPTGTPDPLGWRVESNGVKNRLWKKELQTLANELAWRSPSITFTRNSKWNKIEHRLFSFISMNWRAKPLTSLETIIELLNHTTTQEGLTVQAVLDQHRYPTKVRV